MPLQVENYYKNVGMSDVINGKNLCKVKSKYLLKRIVMGMHNIFFFLKAI